MKIEKSAGIIPIHIGSSGWEVFLVHQRNGDFWGFPKGHIEPSEEPLESAKRELKEETGLEVLTLLPLEPLAENYQFVKNGMTIDKSVLFFPAFTTTDFTIDSNEIIAGQWLSLKEASEKLTYPQLKALFARLIAAL